METSKKRTINVDDDGDHSKKSKYVEDDEFGNSIREILSEFYDEEDNQYQMLD